MEELIHTTKFYETLCLPRIIKKSEMPRKHVQLFFLENPCETQAEGKPYKLFDSGLKRDNPVQIKLPHASKVSLTILRY